MNTTAGGTKRMTVVHKIDAPPEDSRFQFIRDGEWVCYNCGWNKAAHENNFCVKYNGGSNPG